MKKEVAEMWVEALRSGKYEQTKHCLQNEHGYCCLGVLTKISPKEDFINDHGFLEGYSLSIGTMSWAEMLTSGGDLDENNNLATLNDGSDSREPLTFDEIADVIQMCWEEL